MQFSSPLRSHGRVLDSSGQALGTCFQVDDRILVTALHVLREAAADHVGATVQCQPMEEHYGESAPIEAVVRAVSEDHDIAILATDGCFSESVRNLAVFDGQQPNAEMTLTGFAVEPRRDAYRQYRHYTTTAFWEGSRQDATGLTTGRAVGDGVAQGMSGCAVMRSSDGAVLGVMINRINSTDGWSKSRITVTRSEDLYELLREVAPTVPIDRRVLRHDPIPMLREASLERQKILRDESSVEVADWIDAQREGIDSLRAGKIVFVVCPPGVGATTFSEQMLAKASTQSGDISVLEPDDWDQPDASMLPLVARRGYLLELIDPGDMPTESFLDRISEAAPNYFAMRSMLVITVREDLWRVGRYLSMHDIKVIRLTSSPDSLKLVHRCAEISYPKLLPMLRYDSISSHIRGLNAVQASQTFAKLVNVCESARSMDDEDLKTLLVDVLDDHADELDQRFAESDEQSARSSNSSFSRLSLRDRCLLFTLAFQGESRLSKLEESSKELERMLAESGGTSSAARYVPLDQVFSSAGLRGRLRNITADVRPGERVSLSRSGFANATVNYVWNNYASMRSVLTSWMLASIDGDPNLREKMVGLIADLVRRNQAIDLLRNDLKQVFSSRGSLDLFADIVIKVMGDAHLQRRVERLLYEWASRAEMRSLVVRVSLTLIGGERRHIGLKRLQRATNANDLDDGLSGEILEGFRFMVRTEGVSQSLVNFRPWFDVEKSSSAAVLAFCSLLEHEDFVPVLLETPLENGYIIRMMGKSMVDPRVVDSLGALMQRVNSNDAQYDQLVERLAYSSTLVGTVGTAIGVALEIRDSGLAGRRDLVEDLAAHFRFSDPEIQEQSSGVTPA